MIHSLRLRLLLALMVVVAAAVGTVALLAARVSAAELQRYLELDRQRTERMMEALRARYSAEDGLSDPQGAAVELAQTFGERIVVIGADKLILADSQRALRGTTYACDQVIEGVLVTIGPPHCVSSIASDQLTLAEPGSPSEGILFIVSIPPGVPVDGATQPTTQTVRLRVVPESQMTPDGALAAAALGSQLEYNAGPMLSFSRQQGAELDPIRAAFVSQVNRSLLLASGVAALMALLVTALVSRRILGPVEALTAAARRMERGDLGQRVDATSRDEIGELARSFNAMADSLTRAEQLRRNMVTDVAHELRTPLTNIRGYLEALRDGVASPDPQTIDSLHEEALLLNRLVDDLQDLAVAEAGQLRLLCAPTPPAALVERAVDAMRPAAAEKGLCLGAELSCAVPDVVADARRVGQVLRNLLANAVMHTPPGGSVAVGVTVGGSVADSGHDPVVFYVRDTGVGIAPEDLPNIFERFYRADRSRARATGGAGLGLTIVRQLVEAHGGQVWAESQPGAGATFFFTLPAAEA